MAHSIVVAGNDSGLRREIISLLRTAQDVEVVEARTSDEAMQLTGTSPRKAVLLLGTEACSPELADRIATEYAVPSILILSAAADYPDVAAHEGIIAALVSPVSAAQLHLGIAVASRRFQEMIALRREIQTLRRGIEDRKTIERAKGLLMEMTAATEREAYARIRTKSMDTQRPMVEIARAIILAYEMNGGVASPLVKR